MESGPGGFTPHDPIEAGMKHEAELAKWYAKFESKELDPDDLIKEWGDIQMKRPPIGDYVSCFDTYTHPKYQAAIAWKFRNMSIWDFLRITGPKSANQDQDPQ